MLLEAESQPKLDDNHLELLIDFGVAGNSSEYRRAGWAKPERRHTWTIGVESRLELPALITSGIYRMRIGLGPFVSAPALPGQRLVVLINGREIGNFFVREVRTIEFSINTKTIGHAAPIVITFRHPDAARPRAVSGVPDDRELALAFEWLALWREVGTRDLEAGSRHVPVTDSSKLFDTREYFAWIGFWAQFVVLASVAIFGAAYAGDCSDPGAYRCGLWISFAAVVLAFLRLKQTFDARRGHRTSRLLFEDLCSPVPMIAVSLALGVTGLFLAGIHSGDAHDAGLLLVGASGFPLLVSLKRCLTSGRRTTGFLDRVLLG